MTAFLRTRGAVFAFLTGIMLLAPTLVSADTYGSKLGLGFMLGNPLGGNIKGWVNDSQAIDGGIGLGFLGGEHLQVHATYLWHFEAVSEPTVDMDFYTGLGPALDIKENRKIPTYLYLRVSAGLNFTFQKLKENGAPIDFFVEAAPLFGKGVKVDANLGARYWF